MDHILTEMLARYQTESLADRKNAVKEVMQEIVLCGLSRSGFFKSAAFYGGTALRIFYGLDRFSEDLDFSLVKKEETFDLEKYFAVLKREVHAFGLNVTISEKEKVKETDIQSAFVKGNTREHLMLFYDRELAGTVSANEMIKIKFEVDTNPPPYAGYERKYRLLPSPYEVNIFDEPSLFAGKIHAVLFRGWKNRIKGRDLYDYVYYLSQNIPVNLSHLESRLHQTCSLPETESLHIDKLKAMLCQRFGEINYKEAREDVLPFITRPEKLALWSSEFFTTITENLQER